MLFKLVFVTTLFLAIVLGSPVPDETLRECTTEENRQSAAYTMSYTAQEFSGVFPKDTSKNEEYKKSCHDAHEAFDANIHLLSKCGPQDGLEFGRKIGTNMKMMCDGLHFVANNFTECHEKLNKRSNSCYLAWNLPLINRPKEHEVTKQQCKDTFGKNDCLKEEIIEACGAEEWKQFRKFIVDLHNTQLKKCDFEEDQ